MTENADRLEVSRLIGADAAAIFDVLSTPAGHVRIDSTGMLQAADGNPVQGVGDQFVVHMDRDALNDVPMGRYDVTVHITEFERDHSIEWMISLDDGQPLVYRYGYHLDTAPSGTLVTSYYDWSRVSEPYRSRGIFPVIPEANLRATLGILARTVERPS